MSLDSEDSPARVPQNAAGDFYVQQDVCLRCCIPHALAPELMNDSTQDFQHCYFRRQPETPQEVEQAIDAIRSSDIGLLRYGGSDPEILRRLKELGCGSLCDQKLDPKK